jgi:hypothetical protein
VTPARTTIVGVRFRPGTAPRLPTVLDDLADHSELNELKEQTHA